MITSVTQIIICQVKTVALALSIAFGLAPSEIYLFRSVNAVSMTNQLKINCLTLYSFNLILAINVAIL